MDSPDLGHDRPDKTSKVKDDANGKRSQGHRENREMDRTTIGRNYYSLSEKFSKRKSRSTYAGSLGQMIARWKKCGDHDHYTLSCVPPSTNRSVEQLE